MIHIAVYKALSVIGLCIQRVRCAVLLRRHTGEPVHAVITVADLPSVAPEALCKEAVPLPVAVADDLCPCYGHFRAIAEAIIGKRIVTAMVADLGQPVLLIGIAFVDVRLGKTGAGPA